MGRAGTAGHDVDLLDEQLRELADVGHASDVGRHDTLAVQQRQGADQTRPRMLSELRPLQAAAGAVGEGGAAGAALQGGQLDDAGRCSGGPFFQGRTR